MPQPSQGFHDQREAVCQIIARPAIEPHRGAALGIGYTSRISSSLLPPWPSAASKPLMSGTVSISQTMTLLMRHQRLVLYRHRTSGKPATPSSLPAPTKPVTASPSSPHRADEIAQLGRDSRPANRLA